MVSDEFSSFHGRIKDEPSQDVEESQDGQQLVENDYEGEDLLREKIDGKMALHRERLDRDWK